MLNTVSIHPGDVPQGILHGYLLGAVGPRPIAFASTVDEVGRPNLAPFSFFNVFSSAPPVLIFSPARRGRDNTTKHTLDNVLKTKEVVINIVNFEIVQQTSLASSEYAEGINEFNKTGLTMIKSDLVAPFRVAESPVQFECRVTKIESLGTQGGAGNLIFSEVVKIHIHEHLLSKDGTIDQAGIDQVARMGGNWYTRANKGMFEVPKPASKPGIGVDQLPEPVRRSGILTGNNLGQLGNVEKLPSREEVEAFVNSDRELNALINTQDETQIHKKAQEYLNKNDVLSAWKILIAK